MQYINKVEISGTISEVRTSEKGTHFVMLKQIVNHNGVDYDRIFELLVNPAKINIIDKLIIGKQAKFYGALTIFKIKKYNIHKMIIDVTEIVVE
jgi:hypothetical protein